MFLTLIQPSLLGTLLLLSSLLQWENVTSVPIYDEKTDLGEVSLRDLFDRAAALSQTISDLTVEMRKLFFSDGFSSEMFKRIVLGFFKDKVHMMTTLNSCHTFSLNTPQTVAQARDISLEDFLKTILHIVQSWHIPLQHLVTELHAMKGTPNGIILRAKGIEIINNELLKSIMMILSKVNPKLEYNDNYPVWNDLESFQVDDEESHFLALYKLFYCLRVDIYIVDRYLKHLRCVLLYGDSCYSVEF